MRIRSFRAVLDECLTALQQGESVEACLTRYPKQASRLRPLLTLAQRISRAAAATPRPWAQQTAWNLVRQRALDLRQGRRRPRAQVGWLRPLAIAASLLLALLAAGGGTVYAAQSSLPDSPLYRVKLATEDVRLWFVFDDSEKAEALLDQSDERTEEIMELIQQGKSVPANALSALRDRNARAASILEGRPQETVILGRMLQQSEVQEELLLALWDEVSESARDEYAEAVATLHNTRLRGSGALVSIGPEDLAGGILNISGLVEPATQGVWQVGGMEVRVDERTIGSGALEPGRTAHFVVARGANGRLHALNLSIIDASQPQPGALVSGAVEEVREGQIRVAGQWFDITSETILKLKPKKGERVQITVSEQAGQSVASAVEATDTEAEVTDTPTLAFEGTIESEVSTAEETNKWVIGGQTFLITAATVLDAQGGLLRPGARARVEAVIQGGQLLAQRVVILAADAEAESVHLTGVFQGTREGLWLVSGLAVEAQAVAEPPAPGSLVAIDAERHDNRIVGREATVLEPAGQDNPVRLQGVIASIEGGTWSVGFAQVQVGREAKVSGQAMVGARVLVWGQQGSNGVLQATYVRILDERPIISTEAQ